ncbi:(2Fe-2S)-binding protein [Photobacterium satsumensis]
MTRLTQEEQSLASALLEAGVFTSSADTRTDKKLSPYCLMGVCHGCLVEVDGKHNQRACMTRIKEGMAVVTGEAENETL